MSGFFKRTECTTPIRLTGCASCGLAAGCMHPKMEPTGEGKKNILFVAEAPGGDEDRLGVQLIGKAGQRLRRALRAMGVDLDQDCRKTNSVRCRPPDNTTPEPNQIAACRPHVFEEIRRSKPGVIVAMGGPAVQSLLGARWLHDGNFKISRWRNLAIPDHDLGAWVVPTFHPSYVERSEERSPVVEVLWQKDLERAIGLIGTPLPKKLEPEITVISGAAVGPYLLDVWRAGKGYSVPYANLAPGTKAWKDCWRENPLLQDAMLRYAKNPKIIPGTTNTTTIAFDYETTGLKPYREGHRIKCCAVSDSPKRATAFLWPEDRKTLSLFQSVMEADFIRKIGANNKFEHVWTRQLLGYEVRGWWWDTVIGGHTLDNRRGNANVAFQAYTRLGVLGFKDETDAPLRAADSNAFNHIDDIPIKNLLARCGLDAALEFGIALNQREEMGYDTRN